MSTLSPTVPCSDPTGAAANAPASGETPADAGEQPPEPEPARRDSASTAFAGPVEVTFLADAGAEEPSWLAERLAAAVGESGSQAKRLSVLVVNDDRMADLHRRFMGRDGTTDVLTFVASDEGAPIEADIAVCLDVARREGVRHGHPVAHELLLYALHGFLHCCGFDDHDAEAFAAMHAEEDRVLRAIGIGSTFFRAGSRAGRDESGETTT